MNASPTLLNWSTAIGGLSGYAALAYTLWSDRRRERMEGAELLKIAFVPDWDDWCRLEIILEVPPDHTSYGATVIAVRPRGLRVLTDRFGWPRSDSIEQAQRERSLACSRVASQEMHFGVGLAGLNGPRQAYFALGPEEETFDPMTIDVTIVDLATGRKIARRRTRLRFPEKSRRSRAGEPY